MKRMFMVTAILFAVIAPMAVGTSAAAASGTVDITIDHSRINSSVGDRHTIRSTITNRGATESDRLIAQLLVVSPEGVYQDLEEWTTDPVIKVDPIAPGGTAEVSWNIQTVNKGSFGVYSVVLPNSGASTPGSAVAVSSGVDVTVADARTLSAGGALPVIIAVPIVLALAAAASRRSQRVK
jgi:hypothetical protein